jgi:hypothetical protein
MMEAMLLEKGYGVNWSTLDQPAPKGKFVISLLDPEHGSMLELSKDEYPVLQHYLEQAQDCQILWVTQLTSLTCSDPASGLIHGFARTLRAELLLDISILEVPVWNTNSAKAVIQVCEKIQRRRVQTPLDPEYEFVLHEGKVKIGRYHWTPLAEQLTCPPCSEAARKLTLTAYGLLDTLQWAVKKQCELGAGQVEVGMEFVGLNFKVGSISMYSYYGALTNPRT